MSYLPFSVNRKIKNPRLWHAPVCPGCGCVQYEQVTRLANPYLGYDYLTNPLGFKLEGVQCKLCHKAWPSYRLNLATHTLDVGYDQRLQGKDL